MGLKPWPLCGQTNGLKVDPDPHPSSAENKLCWGRAIGFYMKRPTGKYRNEGPRLDWRSWANPESDPLWHRCRVPGHVVELPTPRLAGDLTPTRIASDLAQL